MCDACVIDDVKRRMLSRRDFFRASAGAGAAAALGAEFLMDRPQSSMVAFLALGNVVVVVAGVVLVSLVPMWRAAGFPMWTIA